MAQEQAPATHGVSRRSFLLAATISGGAVIAAELTPSPAKAAKMSPTAMSYRPSPNGNQRCDNCTNFQPPAACKVVDGAISPSGWCMLYHAK